MSIQPFIMNTYNVFFLLVAPERTQIKLRVFINRYLRTILNIKWPKVVSNKERRELVEQENAVV